MRKLSLVIIAIVGLVATVLYFSMKQDDQDTVNWTPDHRFYVQVTTNTLVHLVEQVGGEAVGVSPIVSSDIEPHEYEPTANDIITGLSSDLFIMIGAGIDVWAQTIVDQREVEDKPNIIVLDPVAQDPHFWLDPISVIDFVGQVRDAFIEIDPEYAELYRANAQSYIDELTLLDLDYRAQLVECARPEVVVAHDAFNYLAERYGFAVYAVSGISPEAEPTPSDLAELAELINEHDLEVVFFEETAADEIAQVLADETGTTAQVLYTIEIIPSDETYLSLMQANLNKLADAMLCQ